MWYIESEKGSRIIIADSYKKALQKAYKDVDTVFYIRLAVEEDVDFFLAMGGKIVTA